MSNIIINSHLPIAPPTPVFSSLYDDATDWTQIATKVTVNGTKANWCEAVAAASNDPLQQVIQDMGVTLSNTDWYAEFTYINGIGGTVGGYPLVFQNTTGDFGIFGGAGVAFTETNPNKIHITTKNAGSNTGQTGNINVTAGTTYYIKMERTTTTTITLSVFTDVGRTTHAAGSPVTATNALLSGVTGLTHVQSQNQTTGGGGDTNFELTDLYVY